MKYLPITILVALLIYSLDNLSDILAKKTSRKYPLVGLLVSSGAFLGLAAGTIILFAVKNMDILYYLACINPGWLILGVFLGLSPRLYKIIKKYR